MSSKIKYVCNMVLVALASTLLLGFGQELAAQSDTPGESTIQGTWRVSVELLNCQTRKGIGEPFQSLVTFNEGGTVAESTANPHFYPMERLPGQGYWASLGNGAYQASSIALVTSNGVLAETQRIDQAISLIGDQFTSDAKVQFLDPQGKLLKSGCATAVAVRYR